MKRNDIGEPTVKRRRPSRALAVLLAASMIATSVPQSAFASAAEQEYAQTEAMEAYEEPAGEDGLDDAVLDGGDQSQDIADSVQDYGAAADESQESVPDGGMADESYESVPDGGMAGESQEDIADGGIAADNSQIYDEPTDGGLYGDTEDGWNDGDAPGAEEMLPLPEEEVPQEDIYGEEPLNEAPARYLDVADTAELLLPAGYADPEGTLCLADVFYDPEDMELSYYVSIDGAGLEPAPVDEGENYTYPDALFEAGSVHTFTFVADDGLEQSADTYTVTVRGAYVQSAAYGKEGDADSGAALLVLSDYPVLSAEAAEGETEDQVNVHALLDASTPADAHVKLTLHDGAGLFSHLYYTEEDAGSYAELAESGALLADPAYDLQLADGCAEAAIYRYTENFASAKEFRIALESGAPETEEPDGSMGTQDGAEEADGSMETQDGAADGQVSPGLWQMMPETEADQPEEISAMSADGTMAIAETQAEETETEGSFTLNVSFDGDDTVIEGAPENVTMEVYSITGRNNYKKATPEDLLAEGNSVQRTCLDKETSCILIKIPMDQLQGKELENGSVKLCTITASKQDSLPNSYKVRNKDLEIKMPSSLSTSWSMASSPANYSGDYLSYWSSYTKSVQGFVRKDADAFYIALDQYGSSTTTSSKNYCRFPDITVRITLHDQTGEYLKLKTSAPKSAEYNSIITNGTQFTQSLTVKDAQGSMKFEGTPAGGGATVEERIRDYPDGSVVTARLDSVTDKDGQPQPYRVVDWQIAAGTTAPNVSVSGILDGSAKNPLTGYQYAFDVNSGELTVTAPTGQQIKAFSVCPVVWVLKDSFTMIAKEPVQAGNSDGSSSFVGSVSFTAKGGTEEVSGTPGKDRTEWQPAELPEEGPIIVTAKLDTLSVIEDKEERQLNNTDYQVRGWRIYNGEGSNAAYVNLDEIDRDPSKNPKAVNGCQYSFDKTSGELTIEIPNRLQLPSNIIVCPIVAVRAEMFAVATQRPLEKGEALGTTLANLGYPSVQLGTGDLPGEEQEGPIASAKQIAWQFENLPQEGPVTVTLTMEPEGLVNKAAKHPIEYEMCDWCIGAWSKTTSPSYMVSDILSGTATDPFAEYGYQYAIDPETKALTVTAESRMSLADLYVRPVVQMVSEYEVPVTAGPEASGLRVISYLSNSIKKQLPEPAASVTMGFGKNTVVKRGAYQVISWEAYLDPETYYEDAYDKVTLSVLKDGEPYQDVTNDSKKSSTSKSFLDAKLTPNNKQYQGSLTFSRQYLRFALSNILETAYQKYDVSAVVTAEKGDVPISFAQDEEAEAKISYNLTRDGEPVASDSDLTLSGTDARTVFTLLANGEPEDEQTQAALDLEAEYELTVRLAGNSEDFILKNWTINGVDAADISSLKYPKEFQASVTEDHALVIRAAGAYLPFLKIMATFRSAQEVECQVTEPEGNDALRYYMRLEDADGKIIKTLVDGEASGSAIIEARDIEAGTYRLRVEALRPGKTAGSWPEDITGANYLCGWRTETELEELAKKEGWELRQELSPGFSYGYEVIILEFTADAFFAYLDELKEAGEDPTPWKFQVLTDQEGEGEPKFTVTPSVSDPDLGTVAAEFVENTEVDGEPASVWLLKVATLQEGKALNSWRRKEGEDFAEPDLYSQDKYRYPVTVTEDTEYQAVLGEPNLTLTGEYMGTFPVDTNYLADTGSEWEKLSSIRNGKAITYEPDLKKYKAENSVAMQAYGPAALTFGMTYPPYMSENGYTITIQFYAGKTADGEPFKEYTKKGEGGANTSNYYIVGVDALPDTEYVTVVASCSDGKRSTRHTYPLYQRPIPGEEKTLDYLSQLKEVYEESLEKIKKAHTYDGYGSPTTYTYSSEYIMLRWEYENAPTVLAALSGEAAKERFEKEKEILQKIGDGIIPEDVGVRVGGYGEVAAVPEGIYVVDAMGALFEKANPGKWKLGLHGSWVNYADPRPREPGPGVREENSTMGGGWQYNIRGWSPSEGQYAEYAPLGVVSMIMLDGDFIYSAVDELEWALQCVGICRGAEAEAEARASGATTVEELAEKYHISVDKLREAPMPREITDWIQAINDITPVTITKGTFGHSFNEKAITGSPVVGRKIEKAQSLRPTGIYATRMTNSEIGKAFGKMQSLYNAQASGSLDVDTDAKGRLANVLNYLLETEQGELGSEWGILALARGGKITKESQLAKTWLAALDKSLAAGAFGGLGETGGDGLGGYTEYERIALTLTALGIDASSYSAGGKTYNFIEKILSYDKVTEQGLNAVAFGLLALDSGNYDGGNTEIRRRYTDYILSYELPKGGWNLEGIGQANADVTAMVLQALAPYRNVSGVSGAVERAMSALQAQQDDLYGDFGYEGSLSAESTAQVLVALSALGVDGKTATGWMTRYGGSVVAGLLHYYKAISGHADMGAFEHASGQGIDLMATRQAAYALVAYDRYTERQKSLYDMTDTVQSGYAHVHSYDGGRVTKAATCVAAGAKTYTCTVCGAARTETIPATGAHRFGEWTTTKEPTEKTDGLQTRTCLVCGAKETDTIPHLTQGYYAPYIEMNAKSIVLQMKQKTTALKVTGMMKGDAVKSWKSSNTKIVKVDKKGRITAQKKKGKAYITITTKYGASVKVKVTVQKGKVRTKKITGVKKSITMKKGARLALKPVRTPITSQEKLTYRSTNKRILAVSRNGSVRAKRKGKATIVIKSGKKTFKCRITVK